MILRRIGMHIRRQDWFVVGIEILIVVVGIFIGLQVDDWNQNRQKVAMEREYLARMQNEFDRLLEVEQGRLRWNEARLAQGEVIKEVIVNRHLPEDKRTSFEYGLHLLGMVNRPRMSWGTVEELRSTGNIQLIRDLSLRQALTDAENEFEWNDRYISEFATMALNYRQELYKNYRLITHPKPGEGIELEIEYDESVFWSDPSLANMILKLVEYQEHTDLSFRENLARIEDLRDQIADIRRNRFGDE